MSKKSALFILLKHTVFQVSNSWRVVKGFMFHEISLTQPILRIGSCREKQKSVYHVTSGKKK